MKNLKKLFVASLLITALISCGGGGGGSSSGGDGNTWRVQANVTQNGCGERIAAVNQKFVINTDGDTALIDTSIATAQGTSDGDTVVAGYSEAKGDCTRSHQIDINGLGNDAAQVILTSSTQCLNGVNCVNTWTGTATREATTLSADEADFTEADFRVRGENCIAPTAEVGYRPSVFECNGTAAILLRGSRRNNYSVVVRRNGEFNDRDPANPTCGTNRCSPYKTQKTIELPSQQINCLGDSGFSALYDTVLRMSIKFTALVTNANDPQQFEQYCIANPEASFN